MIEKIKELELKNKSLNEIMKDKSKTLQRKNIEMAKHKAKNMFTIDYLKKKLNKNSNNNESDFFEIKKLEDNFINS